MPTLIDEIEEKTEASNLQQAPSEGVEIADEASDYQSFGSEDDEYPSPLETEETERKMTTSYSQEESSDQQPTVENDEVSSEKPETDEVSDYNGSTSPESSGSSSPLTIIKYRFRPHHEWEEFDETSAELSRSSSSTSFVSSSSASQTQAHRRKQRRNFFQRLLGVSPGKPTLTIQIVNLQKPRNIQQMISYQDAFKVFTKKQLKKVTNNYNWIIGEGGNGVVYKGMLDDQRVVAVRKSKDVDSRTIDKYSYEIFILSKINHVNVVKLLGWCLEGEVPMLVYEYISNGSLLELIHSKRFKHVVFPLHTRLRIATEVAEALAYLHSGASPPIVHGNVSSSNILLDEDYTVKISGFGGLPLASKDDDRFVRVLPGTLGYMAPDYRHFDTQTDKTDVYSFGVLLVELLTRKMVSIDLPLNKRRYLSKTFLSCMRKNKLLDILDPSITSEGLTEQLGQVTDLAAKCLSSKGVERPTMREVYLELEALRRLKKHTWLLENTEEIQEMR